MCFFKSKSFTWPNLVTHECLCLVGVWFHWRVFWASTPPTLITDLIWHWWNSTLHALLTFYAQLEFVLKCLSRICLNCRKNNTQFVFKLNPFLKPPSIFELIRMWVHWHQCEELADHVHSFFDCGSNALAIFCLILRWTHELRDDRRNRCWRPTSGMLKPIFVLNLLTFWAMSLWGRTRLHVLRVLHLCFKNGNFRAFLKKALNKLC